MKKSVIGMVMVLFLFMCQGFCLAQTKETFPLKVGAAKVDVTPKNQPTAPATGKYDHERAYVRVIVLDNSSTRAVLIGVEGNLDNSSWAELLKQITAELNCPVENIVISTTHSHSLGAGGPRLLPGTPGSDAPQPISANCR